MERHKRATIMSNPQFYWHMHQSWETVPTVQFLSAEANPCWASSQDFATGIEIDYLTSHLHFNAKAEADLASMLSVLHAPVNAETGETQKHSPQWYAEIAKHRKGKLTKRLRRVVLEDWIVPTCVSHMQTHAKFIHPWELSFLNYLEAPKERRRAEYVNYFTKICPSPDAMIATFRSDTIDKDEKMSLYASHGAKELLRTLYPTVEEEKNTALLLSRLFSACAYLTDISFPQLLDGYFLLAYWDTSHDDWYR